MSLCLRLWRGNIKGMRLDENTTADRDFYESEVLWKQRTVSVHSFQAIHDGVWAKYESWCRENHYWDDQDLVHRHTAYLYLNNRANAN